MKILHVVPSISPVRGGPSTAILEMVHALKYVGVEADIAATNDNMESLIQFEKLTKTYWKGIPVFFLKRVGV